MNTPLSYLKVSPLRRFASALVEGLQTELDLTPKPGLVDLSNNGSHVDLNYELMSRSIELLAEYYLECADALESGCGIETLRELGVAAEEIMLRRFATNTHRGAIFLGGLMLAGVYRAGGQGSSATSAAIAMEAKRLFAKQLPTNTTGAEIRGRFQAGGVIAEALSGLPSVFKVGVPAMKKGYALGMSSQEAHLLTLAGLMQQVEDTTALRRCGTLGLTRIREDGQHLEKLLFEGMRPYPFLIETDRQYRSRRLTMGGIADLFAMCIAWYYRNSPATPSEMIESPVQLSLG